MPFADPAADLRFVWITDIGPFEVVAYRWEVSAEIFAYGVAREAYSARDFANRDPLSMECPDQVPCLAFVSISLACLEDL